jgi:signal transduction histidine kinase
MADVPPATDLAAVIADQALQIEALQMELDETNRGVVALYAELDNQAQQLQRATELKSRFLAYMSHEFRTPIAALRSLARLMLDRVDGPLTPEQERQLTFIDQAGSTSRRRGSRWWTCSPRCAACSARC